MTETDSRPAYCLAAGLVFGWLAYSLHWLPGANLLAFAAMPAAAIVGHYLLDAWRTAAGRDRLEPLMGYMTVLAFAWILFGWLFARSQWVSALAGLLAVSLLLPMLIDWALERGALKGGEPAGNDEDALIEAD